MYTGFKVMMGPTAVLEVDGRMQIVVVSRHHEPWDTGVFRSVGIDPEHKRYLLLKSRIHYRAGFAPLAKATFTLDGEGATTSDNSILTYEKLRRRSEEHTSELQSLMHISYTVFCVQKKKH